MRRFRVRPIRMLARSRTLWVSRATGASLLAAWAAPVIASDPSPAILSTQEIVVTASRLLRDTQSEPVTVYRIPSPAVLTERQARTTPDALREVPSTLIQKTSYGQGSPYLRGFTGFRTLALVDGIRLNNSVFRDGPNQYWNTVDPSSIESYELTLGPASSLYGSDAIGGVLNARLAVPPDWAGEPTWSPGIFYRGSSADRSTIGRIELGLRPAEAVGLMGGWTLKQFGDLRAGHGTGLQPNTGYDEWDADARADLQIGAHSRVTLAHQSVRQDDVWRTHRTPYGVRWHGLSAGDDRVHSYDQARDLTYLRYRGEDWAAGLDAVEATLSRHAQSEDLYRVRKDGRQDRQGFEVDTLGAALGMASSSRAGTWVVGAEYYRDRVDSYSRRYDADGRLTSVGIQGPVADDARYESLGVYAQNTLPVGRTRWEVTPGVRYSRICAEADRVQDPASGEVFSLRRDWDAVTASLRLLWALTGDRRCVAFAGVGQGFRAPNLSDLTRFDVARSGEVETPSPDLKPEHFLGSEIGVKVHTHRWTAGVAAYYTLLDDVIVRTPTGRALEDGIEVAKMNSGSGYVGGVDMSSALRITRWLSVRTSAFWMEGKVAAYPTSETRRERDYLSRLAPPTARLGVRVQSPGGRWWIETLGEMADKADRLSADDRRDTQRIPPGGTPGYAVATLRGGVRMSPEIEVSVGLENIFDKDYRIHGSGVNEPGRNLVLAARARF